MLDQWTASIMARGPDRVVINREGEALGSRRAREMGVTPDVIFIRDDGWSLGAPARLRGVAESMWRDQWAGVLTRPETKAVPYGP